MGDRLMQAFVFQMERPAVGTPVGTTSNLADLPTGVHAEEEPRLEAKDVALQYFELFNRRDIPALLDLIADDCVHHNLAYSQRSNGKQKIVRFFYDFLNSVPDDVMFRVEDITCGDKHKAGVIWTMEMGGVQVPGGSGVSFYEVNEEGKLIYMRESPEHFVKATGMALPALNALSPLVKSLGTEAANLIEQASTRGLLSLLPASGAGASTAAPEGNPILPLANMLTQLSAGSSSLAEALGGGSNGAGMAGASMSGLSMPAPASALGGVTMNGTGPDPAAVASTSRGQGITMVPLGEPAVSTSGHAGADTGGHGAAVLERSEPAVDAEPGIGVNLTGMWHKDKQDKVAEDAAYDRALSLLKLSKIQMETGKMIDSLSLKHTKDGELSVGFVTPVPYFKVTETYKLNATTQMGRRDLRQGKTTASMRLLEGGRGYVVDMSWPNPLQGNLEEVYTLLDDNTMTLKSTISVGGKEECVTFTYRRA